MKEAKVKKLLCGRRQLDLSSVNVMGILNVTPDSFSDGGSLYRNRKVNGDVVLERALTMVSDGASILDVGGESTRPDAKVVSDQEEMDRVLPAIELLIKNVDVVVSVDTSSPILMVEAAKLGAGLLNDVRALEREGAIKAALATKLPVCLMHMNGTPKTMQSSPVYHDVVAEVYSYLVGRAAICEQNGIAKDQIILDPGFGFGKTMEQNFELLHQTRFFVQSGYHVLIGTSRKSMFGQLLGREVGDRLASSLASIAYAVMNGAAIVRVHDVKETVDVVQVIEKIINSGKVGAA